MTITEQITRIKGQINYTKQALKSDLMAWERKEYENLLNCYNEELSRLITYSNIHNLEIPNN